MANLSLRSFSDYIVPTQSVTAIKLRNTLIPKLDLGPLMTKLSATAPALLYLLHNPQGCGE